MKKTVKLVTTAKYRWFWLVLTLLLLTAPKGPVVAQTISLEPIFTSLGITIEPPTAPEPVEPPAVQDVLLSVCQDRGYGEECAKTLLGMAWKESRFKGDARGDYDRKGFPHARGWFQIHYLLHDISTDCAEDLICSANWTIDYLESNHYPKYVKYAVQCHNSCNNPNKYAENAIWHGKRLWNDKEAQKLAVAN